MEFSIKKTAIRDFAEKFEKKPVQTIAGILSIVSVVTFIYYYQNGLGLKYNDARSHLDIARRVVEGLKTGAAQLGSVWLPLPHILMLPTIWNDFFWHSGLSGAIVSMISFVAVGVLIYKYLKALGVGVLARYFGVLVFVLNINVLYMQSTAMTELLLLATMTAGSYYLLLWSRKKRLVDILKSALWIMLSTAIRYDGWFLLGFSAMIISYISFRKKGFEEAEGVTILFLTLGSLAIFLWVIWNWLIFNDPLYFILGPFSAHAQQAQIDAAGELYTKGNWFISTISYIYALMYNSYSVPAVFGLIGFLGLLKDKIFKIEVKIASLALISPFIFNVLALYFGHSVLFVQGVLTDTWFNVRYGIMLMPSIAIFFAYLVDRLKNIKFSVIAIYLFVMLFAFLGRDAVTIDDALVGASGKNVTEVSGWLKENVTNEKEYVLIAAASHDAIIFSSGLPMSRFVHEGTGPYWKFAIENPEKWVRWIVVRTYDMSDWTWREIVDAPGLSKFELVDHYPFADIYQLKDEFLDEMDPVLPPGTKMNE
ncbi:hypothetical protein JXA63_05290 [Candidatus Woesebacteria bacterium]|nr:hypothetical protein [Candidatus Woesebacteria bacterium]